MTPATSPARGPRPGFTLIELLVVIAIIGILIGLTTAAVQKIREVGVTTRVRNDLTQFDTGISSFKDGMKVKRLPSFGEVTPTNLSGKFRLRKRYVATPAAFPNDVGQSSAEAQFLKQMFPNMYLDPQTERTGMPAGTAAADTAYGNGLPNLDLSPNQSLVFFLGGYYLQVDTSSAGSVATARRQVWLQGYLTDPRTPFRFDAPPASQPTGKKGGPFFEFQPKQLDIDLAVLDPSSGTPPLRDRADNSPANQLAPSYLDPYGVPYMYVSHVGTNGNDYYNGWSSNVNAHLHYNAANPADPTNGLNPNPHTGTRSNSNFFDEFEYFPTSARSGEPIPVVVKDAAGADVRFNPFKQAANRFSNEKTHQIVSAGKDKVFGSGGLFKAANAGAYSDGKTGGDDYTNFAGTKMSAAQ